MSALQNGRKEGSWLAVQWKGWMRRLQALDFWRMLVAFGLACVTSILIRQQGAENTYASWRSVGPVTVSVPREDLGWDVHLLGGDYEVALQVSVDVFHLGNTLTPKDFTVSMDPRRLSALIRSAGVGGGIREVEYVVHPSDVLEKPSGVDIREIRGNVLKVRYEAMVTREVPVHLTLDRRGQQEGWTYDCRLLQGVVTVHGPESVVGGIASLSTEPVYLQDTRAYTGMVRLQVPARWEDVQFSRSQVEYEVRPEQNSMNAVTRAFHDLQVLFLFRGDNFLHPQFLHGVSPRVTLHLTGPSMVLKSLNPEQLRVVCDLTPFTMAGGQDVRLQVLGLPEGVQVAEILPAEVLSLQLIDMREPLRPLGAPSPERQAP